MYGFKEKRTAENLSQFANHLDNNPATGTPMQTPIISDMNFLNDLRYRTYIGLVEVIEDIPAAYWDYTAGPIGRWVAGRGKVRLYMKYTEPDPIPSPRNNNVGLWREVFGSGGDTPEQVYEDKIYECYNYKCVNYENTVSQVPKLYLAWEDVHGTLWIEPTEDQTQQKQFPVEATECILPGQGSTTVKRYIYNGTDWVDSGETCTIHDPTCILMAIPGDIFWVQANAGSGETDPCYPGGSPGTCDANVVAPFGTVRRVRVETEIDCNEEGTATILIQDPTNTSGLCDEVKPESPDNCDIVVCNKSGRKVMCVFIDGDGPDYEDGVATLDPSSCKWYFEADPRATEARVLLTQPLCFDTQEVDVDPANEILDRCNWTEKISKVYNPMKRQACINKIATAKWNAILCRWEVWTVEPHIAESLIEQITTCDDDACSSINQHKYSSVAIETCDCVSTPTTAAILETKYALTSIYTVKGGTPGQQDEVCELWGMVTPFCVLACGNEQPTPTKILDGEKLEYLKSIAEGSDAIECTPGSAFVFGCGESTLPVTPCIELEPCPIEDPVNDV